MAKSAAKNYQLKDVVEFAKNTSSTSVLSWMLARERDTIEKINEWDDITTPIGEVLLEALCIAVKKNDHPTMIVLYSHKRAKQVLKHPILKSPVHHAGREFFKVLASLVSAHPPLAHHIASLYAPSVEFSYDWQTLSPAIDKVHTAVQDLFPSHQQKMALVRAVVHQAPSCPPPPLKRKM